MPAFDNLEAGLFFQDFFADSQAGEATECGLVQRIGRQEVMKSEVDFNTSLAGDWNRRVDRAGTIPDYVAKMPVAAVVEAIGGPIVIGRFIGWVFKAIVGAH